MGKKHDADAHQQSLSCLVGSGLMAKLLFLGRA
jgi:hypothetical protein